MKNESEFYNWCESQKKEAIAMCNGDQEVINEIEKQERPIAHHFQIENGFMQAPGFKAQVLLNRAKNSIDYNKAMTVLQNENIDE